MRAIRGTREGPRQVRCDAPLLYVVLCYAVCVCYMASCDTALSAQLRAVGKRVSSQRLRTRLIVFVVTHTDCAW
jgi:amino acid permease